MKFGLVIVVALVSLVAGVGGGFALSDTNKPLVPATSLAAVLPTAEVTAETPSPPPQDPQFHIAKYIEPGMDVTPQVRAEIARRVDGAFVAAGFEVLVSVKGLSNQTLWIQTAEAPTRVTSYRAAQKLPFEELRAAGFQTLIVSDGASGWGFDVEEVVEQHTLLAPARTAPPK